MAFAFYTDNGLINELIGNMLFTEPADHSSVPADQILYLGSTDADRKIEYDLDPGVGQITIIPTDDDEGNNHEKEEITLALNSEDLETNTAGASLDVGVEVLSGVGNQVAIYVRVRDATATVGTSTELSLLTNSLRETITA